MERYQDSTWCDSMRVRFDFNPMMAEVIGQPYGFEASDVERNAPLVRGALAALRLRRQAGDLEWLELPYQDVSDLLAYADQVRARFETFVVLGIGGSALGTIAVQTALNHPFYNLLPTDRRPGPRLFVLDNVDPDLMAGFLDVVDPARTCFNVISKSGGTAETMAQFLTFRDLLRARVGDRYREHLVVTTSADRGALRPIAEAEGYRSFVIPPGVGGRFSVLCPVGLLPLAVAGIDIRELLAGAAYADGYGWSDDVWTNPAAMNALLQYLAYGRGQHISVMMPYSQRLRDVADWYRQLWAESLGKRVDRAGQVVHVGPTPVKALGATDQHSQVQLYVEGPADKVFNFLFVEEYERDLSIGNGEGSGVAYLGGHTFAELIRAEGEATALALAEAGRPNCAHILPRVNAFTVGQLLYTLELQMAISGELYNINAFDQPGVEAGKVNTYALMGRPGYETRRTEIEAARSRRSARYVIG
jgi:glucose-6-phosphate isomerase